MTDKDMRVRHLLERVLRQYEYVQTIPRPPTDIGRLAVDDVVVTFMEFALHVLDQKERGHPVPNNEPWAHSKGYKRCFIRVSHPIVNCNNPFFAKFILLFIYVCLYIYSYVIIEGEKNHKKGGLNCVF